MRRGFASQALRRPVNGESLLRFRQLKHNLPSSALQKRIPSRNPDAKAFTVRNQNQGDILLPAGKNHNHRPCRWFAQAPLGHVPGRAYRLIEQSANRADFPGMPLKGLFYLPSFTG